MLTYSEYYELVSLGLKSLQEKLLEAQVFTSEQHKVALEKERLSKEQVTNVEEPKNNKEKSSKTEVK